MTQARERHVRAHALREGDQVYHYHKWWSVTKVPAPGEIYKYRDSEGDKEIEVSGFNPALSICVILARGSRRQAATLIKQAIVKVIQCPREGDNGAH